MVGFGDFCTGSPGGGVGVVVDSNLCLICSIYDIVAWVYRTAFIDSGSQVDQHCHTYIESYVCFSRTQRSPSILNTPLQESLIFIPVDSNLDLDLYTG